MPPPCCKSCGRAGVVGVEIERPGHAAASSPPPSPWDDYYARLETRFTSRTLLFICRGLMLLLWLYLFDCMRTYVTNYIGDGDSWFTKFVLIVVAVPMADLFSIFVWLCLRAPMPGYSTLECPKDYKWPGSIISIDANKRYATPPYLRRVSPAASCCGCAGETPTLDDDSDVAPLLDVETGGADWRGRPVEVMMTGTQPHEPTTTDADMHDLNKASVMAIKCVVRGVLIVLWLYMVDLVRRVFSIHIVGAVIAYAVAMFVSFYFWAVSESLDELHLTPTPLTFILRGASSIP